MQDDSDISDGVSRTDFTGFSKLRLGRFFFNAMEGWSCCVFNFINIWFLRDIFFYVILESNMYIE